MSSTKKLLKKKRGEGYEVATWMDADFLWILIITVKAHHLIFIFPNSISIKT